MQFRTFGDPPVPLSLLGFGASRVGSVGNPTPLPALRETLARALDCGVNLFDTADIYGQGDSEREIGRLLKGRRGRGFVVSKAGKRFSARMRMLRPFKPMLRPLLRSRATAVIAQRDAEMTEDFSPAHITASVDRSLRRLGFEQLDGFLLHSPPPDAVAPLGDVLGGLVRAGKVAHYGVSCDERASVERALELPGLTLLELPVDLIGAVADGPFGAVVRTRRIGVIAREALRAWPDLKPAEAFVRAAGLPSITSVVVGLSKPEHLRELAAVASA